MTRFGIGQQAARTPAGGARSPQWRLCVALGVALNAGAAGAGQGIDVPSGQQIELNEVLIDERSGETWVRFRFVAPQIARGTGTVEYAQAASDMDHLCRALVLPYLADYGLSANRVVISLSDRDVPFGTPDSEATQFFEAYRPESATCIWEEF